MLNWRFCVLCLYLFPCFGQILPKDSKHVIDFAFMGGSFFTGSVQAEKDVISKALFSMFKAAGDKKTSFTLENFFDDHELFVRMKNKQVFVAGVSHIFFETYEKDLNLVPLVTPIIDGKKRQHFLIFVKAGHSAIRDAKDLEGKTIATPMYVTQRFYEITQSEVMPSNVVLEQMPEAKSVIMATLYGKTDGGILPEFFFNRFIKMKPYLKRKLLVLGKSKSLVQPPIVCSRDMVSEEKIEELINLFFDSLKNPDVKAHMSLLNVTGFSRVKAVDITRSQK
ncbi:MAG: hypothetical protein CR997_09420 [Acidobacteria bacterium]|nr:MAG: hypothetical protein CR997_09420 [Acidobacteriota bacterium]